MPYKNAEDRAEQHRRWRRENPEADAKLRRASTTRQTERRNLGDVNRVTQIARERKALLIEYKGGMCKDCGGVFPACCYDFDHLRDKEFEIGGNLGRRIETLKIEADKCDLVCANCHRIRTQKRAGA